MRLSLKKHLRKSLFYWMVIIQTSVFSQETIAIDADSNSGSFHHYIGFLHGQTNLATLPNGLDLVQQLKPKFWRNANWNNTQLLADTLHVNTELVISDFYADFKGGYVNAKPWLNWSEYENFVDTLVDQFLAAGAAPTYWDLWNEPNSTVYWTGNIDQFVECVIRTTTILSSIDTTLKLVAPSLGFYSGSFFEVLLDTLALNGIMLDAISWHEFGLPDSLNNHVLDFRNRLMANPQWGNLEVQINEYSPQETHQIPAYKLGWLYHLEQTNVDWANMACWDNLFDGTTNWSGCGYGLNGLFSFDEQTPLPAYWVHRAYAEMTAGDKLLCTGSDAKTLALSSRMDASQEMRILTGRYYSTYNGTYLPGDNGKDSADVTLTISNYPYLSNGTIPLVIQRIPKGDSIDQHMPLQTPITIYDGTATVVSGSIQLVFDDFLDGDVYYIYLNSDTILGLQEKMQSGMEFSLFPNPSSNELVITTANTNGNKTLELMNCVGQFVKEIALNGSTVIIHVTDLPTGIYFLKLGNSIQRFVKE